MSSLTLHSFNNICDHNIGNYDSVIIKNEDMDINLKIIQNEIEFKKLMKKHLKKEIFIEDKKKGYIINDEISIDLLFPEEPELLKLILDMDLFRNFVFMEKVNVNHDKIFEFDNCYFFDDINILSSNEIHLKNSEVNGKLSIYYDRINTINISSSSIHKLNIEHGSYGRIKNIKMYDNNIGSLSMININIKENLEVYNVNFTGEVKLKHIKIKGKFDFTHNKFLDNSKLSIRNSVFNNESTINFIKFKGVFELYKSNFKSKCYLDYEELSQNDFSSIKKGNNKKIIKWTFYNICEIYNRNGKADEYLRSYAHSKTYERLEEKENFNNKKIVNKWLKIEGLKTGINLLTKKIIEVTTAYFTSWKKCLASIIWILFVFFTIYLVFANKIKIGNELLINNGLNYYFKRGLINIDNLGIIFQKIVSIIYFTLITFTTIGYGDMSPIGFLRIIAGIEGLLGMILISIFTITLSRKFHN